MVILQHGGGLRILRLTRLRTRVREIEIIGVFTKKGSIFRISPKKDRIVVSSYRRIVVVPFTCGIGIGILLNFRSFPGRICARSRLTGKLPRQNLVSLSIRTSFDRHAPSFTSCQIFICVGTLHSNIIRFYCTKCRRRFPSTRRRP